MYGKVQQVEAEKGRDPLVKSGQLICPNMHEGYDYGQGSRMLGGPHWFEHGLVEEVPGIVNQVRCFHLELVYESVLARSLPTYAEDEGQQGDKTGRGTLPMGSMFHGQFGPLPLSKVRQVWMSKEMKSA